MGWTGTQTSQSASELITEEIEYGGTHKVVKRSGRYYAIENKETGEVFGLVGLTQRDGNGWVYTKLVDETMGPNEDSPPAAILDLLTPTDAKYALSWRKRARANIELKKSQPKLKPGDTVRLAKPITFMDGIKRDTFTLVKQFTFTDDRGYSIRLPRQWKTRYEWSIV